MCNIKKYIYINIKIYNIKNIYIYKYQKIKYIIKIHNLLLKIIFRDYFHPDLIYY